MAVLVEALTLVVRRLSLDVGYPGGTDAFLQANLELERPPRFICSGDPHLVNLSFYDPEHVRPATRLLIDAGLVELDEESQEFFDFAFVDQHTGPTMPCSWLAWRRHKDGFTLAWDAEEPVGDMAAPEDWTVEQSKGMTRSDIRADIDRMLRLSEEDGIETFLDFDTGLQIRGLARPEEQA